MDTKLTLKLDKSVIEKAKAYAKEHNISLSKIIENYLKAILNAESKDIEITPLVENLSGVIKSSDIDFKKEYSDFLSEKYK